LENQIINDLNWFSKHELNHNGLYAAGWWFVNKELIYILIKNGFTFDFSFSRHIHFINQFSLKLMNENNIQAGDPFQIFAPEIGALTEIQNLIGAPSTPFIQDFNRHLLKIIKNKNQ